MKYIKLISAFFLASILFYSCGGRTGNMTADKNSFSGNSGTTPATSGDASFSATIDGIDISGKGIDELQLQNTAFIYPPQNNGPQTVLFFLYSTKKGDDFYSFRFSFPHKEGIYQVTRANSEQCQCFVRLDFDLRSADNFSLYDQDSITVAINQITSTRISGTFSGKLRLSDDSHGKEYKNAVSVTDGKFDIPSQQEM